MCAYIFYIIATTFQLTGSLLLLLHFMSSNRQAVIKRFAGIGFLERNDKEINYDENLFINEFKKAYLTKAAFAFIALGYIANIFSNIGDNSPLNTALIIILFSIVLMIATECSISCIIKHSSNTNKKITCEELNSLGISAHISSLTEKDIDEIVNKFQV